MSSLGYRQHQPMLTTAAIGSVFEDFYASDTSLGAHLTATRASNATGQHHVLATETARHDQNPAATSALRKSFLSLRAAQFTLGITCLGLAPPYTETYTQPQALVALSLSWANDTVKHFLRDARTVNQYGLEKINFLILSKFPQADIIYSTDFDPDRPETPVLLINVDTADMPIRKQMELEEQVHQAIMSDASSLSAKRHVLINVF